MSQTEFEEHYTALTREITALEADLANAEACKPLADVRRRIETLYQTLRENRLLLETVLENSAANIYAKRKDGRYIYINREMEVTCNVTREQGLGKTDFDLFPEGDRSTVPDQRPQCHDDWQAVGIGGEGGVAAGRTARPIQEGTADFA